MKENVFLRMHHRVRCLLCTDIIECLKKDNTVLLEHVREKHPEIKIAKNSHEVSSP